MAQNGLLLKFSASGGMIYRFELKGPFMALYLSVGGRLWPRSRK